MSVICHDLCFISSQNWKPFLWQRIENLVKIVKMSDYLGRKRQTKLKNPWKILEIPVELPSTMSHSILLDFLIPKTVKLWKWTCEVCRVEGRISFCLGKSKNNYFYRHFLSQPISISKVEISQKGLKQSFSTYLLTKYRILSPFLQVRACGVTLFLSFKYF